ncbi:hypothetical protein scyTo_0019867 [Scyliorhinus torazame]|uniref:Ig-like domain-containing protein n=1 Tax=Scyliorhinus torazame TaxID=75743 RepID=A0A401PT08_SCYTO|nr:hypothetical protein [Scyliorhinus torazame]
MTYVERGQFLQVNKAQASDAGWYTCRARNIAGTMEKSYKVQVYVPPSIEGSTGQPLKIKAVVGHSLSLRCSSSGYPPPVLSWLKDGIRLTSSARIQFVAEGKTLKLEKVGESDAGTYLCVATSASGEQQLQFTVDILVPPQLLIGESSHVTVTVDNPLELTCQVTGHPPPNITWLRNNVPLTELDGARLSADRSKLSIARLKLVDIGRYVCVAGNEAGERRGEFNVTVHVPPEARIAGVQSLPVVVGKSVILECTVTGIPAPLITWLKDGHPLTGRNGRFKIERVTPEDGGIYSCVATNAAGESQQDVKVTVHEPPVMDKSVATDKTATVNFPASFECLASGIPPPVPPNILGDEQNVSVNLNDSVSLECQSQAFPPPILSWMKDGLPIPVRARHRLSANASVLEIQSAQAQDAGRYTCEASNDAGKTEKNYNLDVWVPPAFHGLEDQASVTVIEGNSVSLFCECSGIPSPNLEWQKNGVSLFTGKDGRITILSGRQMLQISSTRISDTGNYTCVGTNLAGTNKKDYSVEVYVTPKIKNGGGRPTEILITRGAGVTLECEAYGIPQPTLTWMKDGRPVVSRRGVRVENEGRTLKVQRAQEHHTGRYTCLAVSVAGRSDRKFDLSVRGKRSSYYWF